MKIKCIHRTVTPPPPPVGALITKPSRIPCHTDPSQGDAVWCPPGGGGGVGHWFNFCVACRECTCIILKTFIYLYLFSF